MAWFCSCSPPLRLTLTMAWRESGLTVTSVTSTEPRRGSESSNPMISESSSRTATETRLERCSSIKVRGSGCWVLAYPPQTAEKFASTQHLEPGTRSLHRSEERRVGKECRSRWSTDQQKQ